MYKESLRNIYDMFRLKFEAKNNRILANQALENPDLTRLYFFQPDYS